MDAENLLESITTTEDETIKREDFIEIEIPYNLYEYISSEHCNVQNMCRICLSTDNEVLYPLLATKENSILAHMFMSLTSVQLSPEEGLPSSICEPCQTQVVQCYEFKIKCENEPCIFRPWYEATDMNIYRSALSACVIMGLPNVYDYIHKHRERLMEEKRQKILLSETARHGQHRTALPDSNRPWLVQVHLMEDNDDMLEQLGLMENQAANIDAPAAPPPPPPPPPLPPQPMEQD